MKRPMIRALTAGLLAVGAGCASDGMPPASIGDAVVPGAVRRFTAEAMSRPRGPLAVAGTAALSPTSAARRDGASTDGWRPSRPDRPTDGTIVPVAGIDGVPPAPAATGLPAEFPATGSPYELPAADVDATAAGAGPAFPAAGRPIDLGAALALVAGQNAEVSFARARVRESYASLDAASVLMLPTIQAGVSYHNHQGQLQDVGGRVLNINRSALNGGFGAGALGAGTVPTPGLVVNFHAADAYFGPEIARRAAWASRHAADATLNDQLLAAALGYLELLRAHQQLAIAHSTQENIDDLAETTARFAAEGQGLRADADRAAADRAIRRNGVLQAEEAVAVASVRLAELLRLDPSEPLLPVEAAVLPIDLAGPCCESRELVATALGRRPELREQRALVAAACERLRREQYAPLVPSVLLGASYTGFGGGVGGNIDDFSDRGDFDALAYWQVRGLGFGERAARAEASARIDQARFRQLRTMDRVAREVVEAKAQLDARGPQIDAAADAVRAAESSYELNRQRISEGQGLPIETLQAVQALDAARREYLRAVTDCNEAEFRLHRALGWPVRG